MGMQRSDLLSFAPSLLACLLSRGATSAMLAAPARDTSKLAMRPMDKTEKTSLSYPTFSTRLGENLKN